ncbi:NAD-dependent epimerase/dehydratase family protein [Motilibacter aurantiacus]|uniref:NAD-dependent epimerase/dehydratase family protein n=1 Tax=Motilibacter aurantiacus TaxID=2714955 RepID=UPI0014079AE6|nr:NAD-dependent epimerase/dehydratase family protein [Motilibacter aurantiacus]NHC43739.1 NAD-dependent epimerase/dehydratase family protein [Motilibacter aurantiacus]
MHVLLTGGTGFIGSAVLRALVADGSEVTALVRSDASAATVAAAGAKPLLTDITDTEAVRAALAGVDAAVHTASPGDATSADVDRAVVSAVTGAFAGTDRPYLHTGGVWVYGSGAALTEDSPLAPPRLTAWRPAVERSLLDAPGLRAGVIAPAIVYGEGAGIPALLAGSPRTAEGALVAIGPGTQHWTTVHVEDLADLYVAALAALRPGDYYIGASGSSPTVNEMLAAVARGAGLPGTVVAEDVEATQQRLGELFAEALLLDQQASGAKARTELSWSPSRPSLLEELESGSYRAQG